MYIHIYMCMQEQPKSPSSDTQYSTQCLKYLTSCSNGGSAVGLLCCGMTLTALSIAAANSVREEGTSSALSSSSSSSSPSFSSSFSCCCPSESCSKSGSGTSLHVSSWSSSPRSCGQE